MNRKQQVNFRIDTDLLEALKQRAEVEGVSYTDLIQKFCRQGLEGSISSHSDNTIQPAIQLDIFKEQLKAELKTEIIGEVKELLATYQAANIRSV